MKLNAMSTEQLAEQVRCREYDGSTFAQVYLRRLGYRIDFHTHDSALFPRGTYTVFTPDGVGSLYSYVSGDELVKIALKEAK